MNRRHILWVGWSFYVANFFLVAGNGMLGLVFADWALTTPWGDDPLHLFYGTMLQHAAILVAGWINLVFLMAAVVKLSGRHQRAFSILRTILILMIPSCFLVSHFQGFHFREGFYTWIFGMLAVLFADNLAGTHGRLTTAAPDDDPAAAVR